ncbi:MAG: type II toxin-antitoxin system mRNA interferase toxin, RelE/StbE family [Candidatus Staskawiczbacteria bacterium]|nr:type II toxin-antitoxin system mRNA interferase toxin, RelE/StbE family [Candidatus Staskawiczbacteria bacterium]
MKIFYHSRFKKSYQKLLIELKSKAEIKEEIFRKNPFHSSLDTHKLHGKLKSKWSFSIDRKYRILFEFDNSNVVFLDIGDHDLYK